MTDLTNKQTDLDFLLKKGMLLIAWLLTYFSPVSEYLLFVGILVFLDTYLGIRYAVKKKEFLSRRLESVVHKTVVYICAILLAHTGEKVLEIDMLLKVTSGWIAYTELVSIDENMQKLMGFSIFKKMISKFKRDDKTQ